MPAIGGQGRGNPEDLRDLPGKEQARQEYTGKNADLAAGGRLLLAAHQATGIREPRIALGLELVAVTALVMSMLARDRGLSTAATSGEAIRRYRQRSGQ